METLDVSSFEPFPLLDLQPGPALVGEAATNVRTTFRGKNFEFKLFLEMKILSK